MTKLILVEDDVKLSMLIQRYLEQHAISVEVVNDGSHAVEIILAKSPDIVILDLMLPGKDGLTICREIRPNFAGCILFLTASEDDMDHVAGVELGADDFIVKPIQPRVLLARIRMLLRRLPSPTSQALGPTNTKSLSADGKKSLTFGYLEIHYTKRQVILDGKPVPLTTNELELLWLLACHVEETLSRDYISMSLRGIEYDGLDRSIDTRVANLRKKLGDNASLSTRIITVRGQGYLFVPDSWL